MLTSDDTSMKDCLDSDADWRAAEKDSDEYREAVRKRARREVESLQKKLGN